MTPAQDTTLDSALEAVTRLAGPFLTKLAGASGIGLITGLALKRVFHFVAICLGFAFIALQLLAHFGMVSVHWDRLEHRAVQLLDSNHDGKLDDKDLQYYVQGLGLLTHGLPNVGGFAAGLLLGLRL